MNEKELLIYRSGMLQGKIDAITFYIGRIDKNFDEEIQKRIDKFQSQLEKVESELIKLQTL